MVTKDFHIVSHISLIFLEACTTLEITHTNDYSNADSCLSILNHVKITAQTIDTDNQMDTQVLRHYCWYDLHPLELTTEGLAL